MFSGSIIVSVSYFIKRERKRKKKTGDVRTRELAQGNSLHAFHVRDPGLIPVKPKYWWSPKYC